MRSLAFGEMDMSPNEFYEMEIVDFSLKKQGFNNNRIWFERIFRRHAMICATASGGEFKKSMTEIWPIEKDGEAKAERKRRLKSGAEQILQMKKLIDAKQKT